jgi:hypothetical protein
MTLKFFMISRVSVNVREKPQVAFSVIILYAIYVMHNFFLFKPSAQFFLHNKPMLHNISSRRAVWMSRGKNINIPILSFIFSSFPVGMFFPCKVAFARIANSFFMLFGQRGSSSDSIPFLKWHKVSLKRKAAFSVLLRIRLNVLRLLAALKWQIKSASSIAYSNIPCLGGMSR